MISPPRKGTSLRGTVCFGIFCVKIDLGALAVASCKNPKNATYAKNRIDCVRCVLRVHALRILVFWLHCKPCIHCVTCDAHWKLHVACRSMKMDLRIGFQAAIRNATDATHAGHATQFTNRNECNARHEKRKGRNDRIGCVRCIFRYFDCVASRASIAYVASNRLEHMSS